MLGWIVKDPGQGVGDLRLFKLAAEDGEFSGTERSAESGDGIGELGSGFGWFE